MAFKSDNIPWNKGLTKETNRLVEKNASNRKGKGGEKTKLRHDENRKKNLGELYHIYNKPEEWKIVCTKCNSKEINYLTFGIFRRRYNDKINGKPVLCRSCSCRGRIVSDEIKLILSEAARHRRTDPINEAKRRRGTSNGLKKWYANMSTEERNELHKKQRDSINNMSYEKKKEWYRKVSEKRKEEMSILGMSDSFNPSYNPHTIPYIEDILNVTFDTKFTHAENDGEFRIYDPIAKKSYYADAYSEELNLWIEFDELGKFESGKLKSEHIDREIRIKEILKCRMIRIKFDKNVHLIRENISLTC